MTTRWRLLLAVFFCGVVQASSASANYPGYTPNFASTQCWTCHNNASGGGGCSSPPCLQQFGLDFAANGRVWNYALASRDSDGDGFTNGRELMDPYGYWRPGDPNPGNGYFAYPGHYTSDMNECGINQIYIQSSYYSYYYDYAYCASNATCTNYTGANLGYGCTCPSGYTAAGSPSGSICNDVNECATANCGVGTCSNSPGSWTCNCPNGYAFNGTTCAQDACSRNVDNCYGGTVCNPVGSDNWTCSCAAGYQSLYYNPNYRRVCSGTLCFWLDGYTCSNVDECSSGSAGCPTSSACVDTTGSFTCTPCGTNAGATGPINNETCVCNPGYAGDPYAGCADTDECLAGSDVCDDTSTLCRNTTGSYACDCLAGFTRVNATICADVDECTNGSATCAADADCLNQPGTYSCDCKDGYYGDGYVCRDENECATNNGGCPVGRTCANTPGGHVCECAAGSVDDGQGGCAAGCGNGRRLAPEECDDGDLEPGDGCDARCRIESGYACRDGGTGPSECMQTCGDLRIQPPFEDCDDGTANSDEEKDACRTNCRRAHCGDGILDTNEACDDGLANSDTAADACRTRCVASYCGDGVIDAAESCDPGGAEPRDESDCGEVACTPVAQPEPGDRDRGGCSAAPASGSFREPSGLAAAAMFLAALVAAGRRRPRGRS